MEAIKNKVIVWGADGFNTLSLLRALGCDNIDVLFLIKGRRNFAVKSKYCKSYVETDNIEDGFNYLMTHFKGEEFKPIVFTSGDDIMIYIDQHKDELDQYFILPGCAKKGETEKYSDKNNMTALAQELGIICPNSIKVQKSSSIENVEYPCLIKPAHEKPGHYNEFKFKVCKNKKTLKRTLKYVRDDSEFIVQDYIPQKEGLLIYGCRMWDGKTVIAGAIIRDRMANGGTSHGYLTSAIPECADMSKVREFVERIDYYGLFSFEYGLCDDKAYFFEVNLRNDGTAHYFYQAGTNLPLAYVYSVANLDYSHIPTQIAENKWFIDEIYDIENVYTRKINKRKWKQQKEQATIFKYYDENDQEPYKVAKKGSKKQIIRDIILKRFRLYIVYLMDKLKVKK